MLVEGIADTELARIFEQLRRGGGTDVKTADGHTVHVEVEHTDPTDVDEHDWV